MIDIPCITIILSKIGKSILNLPLLIFVIRLGFVPFGYFLALSVSFPRPYALL